MANYHDHTDLEHLVDLKEAAPREFAAWARLDAVVAKDGGHIPRNDRERIVLAVAHTTQCVYCLDVHTQGVVRAGATRGEVALPAAAPRSSGTAPQAALIMMPFAQHTAAGESAREAS